MRIDRSWHLTQHLDDGPGKSVTMRVEDRLYPETAAGGFSRDDHRMGFLVRLHAIIEPGMTVLDLGAGRGKWGGDPSRLRRDLGDLRGKVHKLVGADVDPVVLENPMLDEAVVLTPGQPMPFADASFDLITAFSVLEHFDDPAASASELRRILRPGGWIVGWTPNRYGYVGVGARLIPPRLREAILRWAEPHRQAEDGFPPLYRLNSRGALRTCFPPDAFDDYSYTYNGQPFYHGETMLVARFWLALFRVLPPVLRGYYLILLRKR